MVVRVGIVAKARRVFDSGDRRFPLTLSAIVLMSAALAAWGLSEHPVGPPNREAFVTFIGTWASLATVGAVVAAGLFATLSGDQVKDVGNQLSAELAAGLDRAANGVQVIRMPDIGPIVAQPIATPDSSHRVFEEDGIEFEVLPEASTPMAVIGALADALGVQGRATAIGDIASVMRRTGRGNHPWLISLASDPDHVYRVTFGGRGKRSATTERYPMPDFIRDNL